MVCLNALRILASHQAFFKAILLERSGSRGDGLAVTAHRWAEAATRSGERMVPLLLHNLADRTHVSVGKPACKTRPRGCSDATVGCSGVPKKRHPAFSYRKMESGT